MACVWQSDRLPVAGRSDSGWSADDATAATYGGDDSCNVAHLMMTCCPPSSDTKTCWYSRPGLKAMIVVVLVVAAATLTTTTTMAAAVAAAASQRWWCRPTIAAHRMPSDCCIAAAVDGATVAVASNTLIAIFDCDCVTADDANAIRAADRCCLLRYCGAPSYCRFDSRCDIHWRRCVYS